MHIEDKSLEKLLSWLGENDVEFHPDIEIKKSIYGGYGVFARKDLDAGETIFRIPKTCILGGKTCGIGNLLDDFDINGVHGTTMAVLFEKGQGSSSPWYDYLRTFTGDSIPDLPRFWPLEDRNLLKGTEVDYVGGCDDTEVRDTYLNMVKPFIDAHLDLFPDASLHTYDAYIAALSAVCSRAFEVDSYLDSSLVPAADLLNHNDREDAHFQSTFEVCMRCGALNFCEHISDEEIENENAGSDDDMHISDGYEDMSEEEDNDDEPGTLVAIDTEGVPTDNENGLDANAETNAEAEDSDDDEDERDLCDIGLIKKVRSGSEIFNTYGDYGNSLLLAKYGFAIWDNCKETIDLSREVVWYAKSQDLLARINWWSSNFYGCVFQLHPDNYHYEISRLLEHDMDVGDESNLPPDPEEITWRQTIEINSEGIASDGLGLLLSVLSASPQKYLTYKKNVSKGDFRCISRSKDTKILTKLIKKRLTRYDDGNMTSKDYEKSLKSVSDQRKRLIATVRGTEKLVLERALKRTQKKYS